MKRHQPNQSHYYSILRVLGSQTNAGVMHMMGALEAGLTFPQEAAASWVSHEEGRDHFAWIWPGRS